MKVSSFEEANTGFTEVGAGDTALTGQVGACAFVEGFRDLRTGFSPLLSATGLISTML